MSPHRSPFFIGVTGNMRLAGYDHVSSPEKNQSAEVARIRSVVCAVLDWARHVPRDHGDKKGLCLTTGAFERTDAKSFRWNDGVPPTHWEPLGLSNTPIVILTSLAPGADTLVAEAAMDYAERHQDADVSVRAVLPFPFEVYRRATTFVPNDVDGANGETPAQRRLKRVIDRIRLQPGFEPARDEFAVALHAKLDGDPERDLTALIDGEPRRHLRYRAAGEWIAAASHLLLAVCSKTEVDDARDRWSCGAADIVLAKQRGTTFELLDDSNGFAWADNGPVLHVSVDGTRNGAALGGRPLAVLHPNDVRPVVIEHSPPWCRALEDLGTRRPPLVKSAARPVGAEIDEPWWTAGEAVFRGIAQRLEEFNAIDDLPHDKEADEVRGVLGGTWTEHASSFARMAESAIRVRRRAATTARGLDDERGRLLVQLWWLVLLAALSLRAYEHWGVQADRGAHGDTHGWIVHDSVGITQSALLLASLLGLAVIERRHRRYANREVERRRYDYRVLGELLRVQVAWCLTGVRGSVDSDSMQRQRGELAWIRHAAAGTVLPSHRFAEQFRMLAPDDKALLLRRAQAWWVEGQVRFFRENGGKAAGKRHQCHQWGWAFLAAGVLNIAGKFFAALSPAIHHAIQFDPYTIGAWSGGTGMAILLVSYLLRWRHYVKHPSMRSGGHSHASGGASGVWPFGSALVWGWTLTVATITFILPDLASRYTLPSTGSHEWWLILTGTVLVFGALFLAWSERRFHGEDARRYRSMEGLFECAARRLDRLIGDYEHTSDPRTLEEIQSLLFELGREAMDETAEWLNLHRTRPLEPFLAG